MCSQWTVLQRLTSEHAAASRAWRAQRLASGARMERARPSSQRPRCIRMCWPRTLHPSGAPRLAHVLRCMCRPVLCCRHQIKWGAIAMHWSQMAGVCYCQLCRAVQTSSGQTRSFTRIAAHSQHVESVSTPLKCHIQLSGCVSYAGILTRQAAPQRRTPSTPTAPRRASQR